MHQRPAPLRASGSSEAHVVDTGVETFWARSDGIVRRVRRRDGSVAESLIGGRSGVRTGRPVPADAAEQLYLRAKNRPPESSGAGGTVHIVDLFSGCGGLSLGVHEACRALGVECKVSFALDVEPSASKVFVTNFPGARTVTGGVREFFNGNLREKLTPEERRLARKTRAVDFLLGGPPCQGHSDLNNRTRRNDGKNALYLTMVRAAQVLEPEHVLIENVPGALKDRSAVVQRSVEALEELGYCVTTGVVDVSRIGVPQRRRRLVLLASRTGGSSIEAIASGYTVPQRSVRWAIGDLAGTDPTALLDTPANSAADTRARIRYLFDHNLYDLPNAERPPCHSGGAHTYSSIYGRLAWEAPSQTVTTGFYSMCMGRYVHPSKARTLTAHEAARLQFFPDFFDFSPVQRRGQLSTMIGNAVPMKLSYITALELLR